MTVALISHPDCLRHDMGPVHPESPGRLWAIEDQLIASRLESVLRRYDAPLATRAQLERVHDAHYVDTVFAASPLDGTVTIAAETLMGPHTLNAALRAAGAAALGVDLVLRDEAGAVFCSVRPPGHHAGRGSAMGGCFFNNVAVGAAHALATHDVARVAIVDFDVHHGNGTEEIFRDEPRVLLCSSFQHPYYPYDDYLADSDHIVNVPLPAGTGGQRFREALRERWLPALDAFRPQLLLVSAGFDAHYEDDIGQLTLDETDFHWIARQLKTVADRHAGGRVVSVLEGGYDLHALGRSVVAHIQGLIDGATG
ncbi:MAG TPA: histone deacetylase family protein [Acidiferrobacterales bacterium]